MSKIIKASGGDGWSEWHVAKLRSGPYEVKVMSNSERGADGLPRIIFHSEDIQDGRRAVDKAISESSAYAYRMFQ